MKDVTSLIYPVSLVFSAVIGGLAAWGYIGKYKTSLKDDTISNLQGAYASANTRLNELETRLDQLEKENKKLKSANEVILKSINEKPFEELKGIMQDTFVKFNNRLDSIENKIK